MKALALQTWAGRRYYAVEVVGETTARLRVKILVNEVNLPSRRTAVLDDVVLVPKYAVQEVADDDPRLERGPYQGHVFGYSEGTPQPDDRDAWRPMRTCANCGRTWAANPKDECYGCRSRNKLPLAQENAA